MPIYEYRAKSNESNTCQLCSERFEMKQKAGDPPLENCPQCGAPVIKLISSFAVTRNLDTIAKSSGLHKLVRKDKGVYEKKY